MNVQTFLDILGADFYTGVPDSQLKALCNYLMNTYGIDPKHHVIAANEGNCTALAAGYHLATGRVPVVYMQNSGEGNIVNPVASLLNDKVYAIPMIFIIGWRGQPGVHDEPQHIYQGEVTVKLLEDMDISSFVIGKDTTDEDVMAAMSQFKDKLSIGGQVAFVVQKGALSYDESVEYKNGNEMLREEIIKHIVAVSGDDPIVSTTGKASRELFEIREGNASGDSKKKHGRDFLTVGSMGHCSSIALGVAVNKPDKKVWCIDGDGAALMHMGAMPVIANCHPKNLVHIVINNGAHETVGGQPTVMSNLNFYEIARDCGYPYSTCVANYESLDRELNEAKKRDDLSFIEVKCAIGARDDLGRPTTTALENKENFMEYLKE
ncbi:MAG: phosphonopyruvate decarboxylase [Lachnospiraceae bacterium]|nr:phosphonopyruvate decarboxylase [Lachnospiraceae bacterium]